MYINITLTEKDLIDNGNAKLHPMYINFEMFFGLSSHLIRKADLITYDHNGHIHVMKKRGGVLNPNPQLRQVEHKTF